MSLTDDIQQLVRELAELATARDLTIATAESCTGGWIAKACTDLAGSSAWFQGGVVSYSDAAKTELLGVPAALLAEHGAVSEAVVRAMAEGVQERLAVDHAVAVSGIAGPDVGSEDKPVGTVHLAWASTEGLWSAALRLEGDREAVRAATVRVALEGLIKDLGEAG